MKSQIGVILMLASYMSAREVTRIDESFLEFWFFMFSCLTFAAGVWLLTSSLKD